MTPEQGHPPDPTFSLVRVQPDTDRVVRQTRDTVLAGRWTFAVALNPTRSVTVFGRRFVYDVGE